MEQPICPSSGVNEAKKNATRHMKQFICGCVVGNWYWGRGRSQRGSVGVMLLRGCGSEKHNRTCMYGEMLRCVRVNVVTRRNIILHILSVCVCVCAFSLRYPACKAHEMCYVPIGCVSASN